MEGKGDISVQKIAELRAEHKKIHAALPRLEKLLANQSATATAAATTVAAAAAAAATPTILHVTTAAATVDLEAVKPRLPEAFDPTVKRNDVCRFVAELEIYFEAVGCTTPTKDAMRIRLAATLARPRDNIFDVPYDPIGDTIYGYSEQQQPLVLEVICNGRRLQALVDSGASHSVCDRRTLEKIGESLEETQFTATMVDGTKLPIHGKSTLQLQIGALRWKPTLPITNIKGLDFILGRDFLKRFNPEIDWVNRKTCIYNNGKRVELRSWTDTGSVPETTLARFERAVNESNTGYLALVMAAAEEEVLEQYKDIMPDNLPAGVPPARTHEHEIVEEPGAKPVSRAPYRLCPTELTDMKKQIEYLLDRQLIRPSTSPSGAPVLFTPKPDGSLRMCINYRALNKQTALTTAPVLILPDPDRDYVVEADASDQAVGAVLMQHHERSLQPITYLSKKLLQWEKDLAQQDVSRDSEVLLLARDGSRCAAVRHLLRHVPADEEQQAEKKQGYFSLYPYRSSHGKSLASTSSQDFLRPHGGTIPSSW
ncbi:unnamed protein product [Closterium sp. NIES-53]